MYEQKPVIEIITLKIKDHFRVYFSNIDKTPHKHDQKTGNWVAEPHLRLFPFLIAL